METERLVLRDFRPDDLDAYTALCADPVVMRYLGGPVSAERAGRETDAISRYFETSGFGMLAVERRSDGRLLGTCGLSIERWYPDDLQIGWRFFVEHWGHGYATEAALPWRDLAFAVPVPRLISISDTPNAKSHKVMERLGMRHDHTAMLTIEDDRFEAHVFVLTLENWRALTKL